MASEPVILAFDTSAAHCAAGLFFEDRKVTLSEEMGRGQAERLMPMIEELLERAGLRYRDLDRIGVGIGPGNFTGIRISVAAARGLALSLGVPAIGVSCLEALRTRAARDIAAIPAARDMAYLQIGDAEPRIVTRAEVPSGALWPGAPETLIGAIARIARTAPPDGPSPAPLYLRPADAAPAREAPPRILDDA